jgi:hypothetical protein
LKGKKTKKRIKKITIKRMGIAFNIKTKQYQMEMDENEGKKI